VQRGVGDRAHHLVERQAGRNRLADLVERQHFLEPHVFGGQLLALETAAHRVHHFLHLERLHDVVVGATFHRIDRGLDRAEASHDDRHDLRRVMRDRLE
jgi:hypothetical protein